MRIATSIEWTGITWNPVTGCDRVSPGCDHCYALTLARRLKAMGQPRYQADGDPRTSGPGFALTVHQDEIWAPLRWRKPRLVFVNSMSDIAHPRVPRPVLVRIWAAMALSPRHTFQVLTKRPNRLTALLASGAFAREVGRAAAGAPQAPGSPACPGSWTPGPGGDWVPPWPLPNVWVGASVESDRYTWRAGFVRRAPAAVRFLSLEPLLGPLPSLDLDGIDWVIVGGESGAGARPMDLAWAREIVARCRGSGTAPFVKQLGSAAGREAGADPKGGDWDAWPADLKVREFPHADRAARMTGATTSIPPAAASRRPAAEAGQAAHRAAQRPAAVGGSRDRAGLPPFPGKSRRS